MKQFILATFICCFSIGTANSQTIRYDHIGEFGAYGKAWAMVQKDNKFGFIDMKGKVIVPIEYDHIGEFGVQGKPWALVQKNNKFGLIDMKGEVIIPIEYDSPSDLQVKL